MLAALVAGLPGAMADWLTGGILTAILGIVTLWWKVRKEKADNLIAARSVAVEETEAAIGAMGAAVEALQRRVADQSVRITNQDSHLTDQGKRITDMSRRHEAAITHIIQREWWTAKRWPGNRPKDLPEIPDVLVPDVQKIDPTLIVVERVPVKDDLKIRDPTED